MGRGRSGERDTKQIDVFVSYSRAADSRLAPAIQRSLSRLAKKWYRIRALTVFRDQTDLSASNSLGSSIEQALADARFFVLLASPAAAESKWVRKEIEFWQRTKGNDKFIVALTDGTIRWDDELGDFDWEATDALPRSLSGYFDAEPLWQDFTWSRDATHLSLRHSEFRSAIATMAAPVHGRSKRELDNEDVEAHRRLVAIGALVMSVILLLTVGLGVEYLLANAERNRAIRNASDATALSSIAQAQARLADPDTGDDVRAYQWLMAAQSLAVSPAVKGAAYNAALDAVYARPNLLSVTEPASHVADGLTAVTTDGLRAASANKGRLQLWDTRTGLLSGPALKPAATNDFTILAIAFTPNGSRVAAAYDTRIVVWDTASGKKITEFAKDGYTTESLALSPDGNTVAVAGGGVRLWDVRTGKPIGSPITAEGGRVAFSPDGRRIAFDSLDDGGSVVRIRSLGSDNADEFRIGYRNNNISSIAFSPNGRSLAVGTDDGSLQLWDPGSGKRAGSVMSGHRGGIEDITFRPDGTHIATAGQDKTIREWDMATGMAIGFPLTGHGGVVDYVRFTSDGKNLISLGDDGTVRRWDAMTGFAPTGLTSKTARAAIAVDPRGTDVAVGSPDGVRLWNYETGAQVKTLPLPHGAESVSYSQDGKSILIVDYAGGVLLWDGTTVRKVKLDPSISLVTSAAFMPYGKEIVIGSASRKLVFEDLDASLTGKPGASIDIGCAAQHIVVSRDGKRVAYSCDNNKLGIADPDTKSLPVYNTQSTVEAMAFSPDGHTLILGTADGTVWRREDGVKTFIAVGVRRGRVTAIAYSPDGQWFASAGSDGSVVIYPTGATLISARISAYTDPVAALTFTPDSGHLISLGDTDSSARIWHLFPNPLDELCERVPSNMSESDWKKWVSDVIGYQDQCKGKPRA
ncbi:TIR domain-containing protein [Streptomyces sp. NPDC060064]|uniref:TIR domain-containing protein n=1 Tax=Streptomyces sp. NPDC060064 TaxID=3347049 RepID=UPI0036BD2359